MPCGLLGLDADLNIMLLRPGFHWQTQSHRYREFVVIPCPCSRVFLQDLPFQKPPHQKQEKP